MTARSRWRPTAVLPSVPSDRLIGPAGLTLDRTGAPVVAYTLWEGFSSSLRLARRGAGGGYRSEAVTAEGFPQSVVPPPAAPVLLPSGEIRVVEAYGTGNFVGAIE